MKTLPEPMEFTTFVSLLAALEENYALLRMIDDSVKDKSWRMKKNIQTMQTIVRKLDKATSCPKAVADTDEPKAA